MNIYEFIIQLSFWKSIFVLISLSIIGISLVSIGPFVNIHKSHSSTWGSNKKGSNKKGENSPWLNQNKPITAKARTGEPVKKATPKLIFGALMGTLKINAPNVKTHKPAQWAKCQPDKTSQEVFRMDKELCPVCYSPAVRITRGIPSFAFCVKIVNSI